MQCYSNPDQFSSTRQTSIEGSWENRDKKKAESTEPIYSLLVDRKTGTGIVKRKRKKRKRKRRRRMSKASH